MNEIIPWYEKLYWEADYDVGFLEYHCGEWADYFYSNRYTLPSGWRISIEKGILNMHAWATVYNENFPDLKFALDPQGAAMRDLLPVFHRGIISHQPDIWELWKDSR